MGGFDLSESHLRGTLIRYAEQRTNSAADRPISPFHEYASVGNLPEPVWVPHNPKSRDPSQGYPCMEHARESRDKRLEQYGVNGKSVTLTRSSQDSAAPRQTKKRRNGSPAPVNMRMTSLKERGLCSELYKRASWHQAQLFECQLQHGGNDIVNFFYC